VSFCKRPGQPAMRLSASSQPAAELFARPQHGEEVSALLQLPVPCPGTHKRHGWLVHHHLGFVTGMLTQAGLSRASMSTRAKPII